MNVDQKGAHVAHAGSVDSRFGKSKATGASNSAMADAGGFMSLLMSLGATDGQDPSGTDLTAGVGGVLAADGAMTGLLDAQTQLPAQDAAPFSQPQDAMASTPLPLPPGMDVSQLLQQQGMLAAQATQATQATPVRSEGDSELVPAGAVAAVKTPVLTGLTPAQTDAPEAGLPAMPKKAGLAHGKTSNVLSAQPSGAGQATGRQDAGNLPGQGREAVPMRAMEAATSAALSELVAASAPGGEPVRQSARQADAREGAAARGVTEGDPGTPTFQVDRQMDFQTVSASVSGAAPEAAIAEQVHYWISNDVQNAELKLDNWGQSPVEVSISLQGNEARVEFRTDVQELRLVLEGATAQLKDMLQGEGLVLTGVSVGASGTGQGAGGSREQPPRPDVRRATVALPETAAVARPTRAGGSAGRAVDIFV